jgi:cytoskeletal protein RodZ
MSSPQQPENTQQPDTSGVGALLKASRLRIGEELSEVSDVLRIRNVYLEAIEDDRYQDLPGSTYAAGFIRAYADHLGLDSEEIIHRFKGRTSGEEPSSDLVFPEPISQAGIPGGAIVFVGALVVILTYGVWYVNTPEDGFLAELISAVPDRLARLADEKSKPEQAAPAPEPIRKDPGPKTVSETQSAAPAEPEKMLRVAEPATPASAPASGMTDQATPEPEKALEKVAEKAPQAAPASEPKPDAQTPAETEKKPGTEEAPEQQAAAWEPPPGVVKPPESPPAPQLAAPQPVVPQPAAPVEATPATASVGVPVSVGAISPAAPETRIAPPTRMPEPVNAPTVVPMDMIPSVPASPRPQAQAATVAPEAAAPEASVAASTSAAASTREETPEVQSAAETPVREAPAAPAAGGAGHIVVKAKTNSWIQVRDDAAGELVLTRMLMSGDSYIVPDRSGLTLSTGNAGALEILVDGEPVPAVGGEGTVRRRIVLDAERLKSGTAVRE